MPEGSYTLMGEPVFPLSRNKEVLENSSPAWTAPQPSERKNAYGYAVPMGTLQMVLLAAASALIGTEQMVGPGADEDERARAAWWSICNSLERGDRVALQRECVERYGDLPAGPWEDA